MAYKLRDSGDNRPYHDNRLGFTDNYYQIKRIRNLAKENDLAVSAILRAATRIALEDPSRLIALTERLQWGEKRDLC